MSKGRIIFGLLCSIWMFFAGAISLYLSLESGGQTIGIPYFLPIVLFIGGICNSSYFVLKYRQLLRNKN
jgi:hypothetical protein